MSQVKQPAGGTAKKSTGNPPAGSSTVPARQAVPIPQTSDSQGDLVTDLWFRFGRFGWDVAGLGLIAFALITFIGLLGHELGQSWAQGVLISLWVNLVSRAFGWGWPMAVLAIALLGLLCLRRRFSRWPKIPLARVLALEGFAFCLLTFLSILNGFSLNRAEAGQDGGFIGWGLATLLDRIIPVPWGAVLIILLLLLFAGYGTGFMHWVVHLLERWLDEI